MQRLTLFERWRLRSTFRALAGPDLLIDYAEWKASLAIQNELFSRRLFTLIDTDASGYIDEQEFISFISLMKKGSLQARLGFVFDVYDLQSDGCFDRSEIRTVLSASLQEQGLSLSDDVLNKLVRAFASKADVDGDRKISKSDFVALLEGQPGVERQLDNFVGLWSRRRRRRQSEDLPGVSFTTRVRRWAARRAVSVILLIAYVISLAALAWMVSQQHADAPMAVQVARTAGAWLNLHGALILVPMCRASWSWVQRRRSARWLPVDQLLGMHRWLGVGIVVAGLIHTIAHMIHVSGLGVQSVHALLLAPIGWTGLLMWLLLLLMVRGIHNRKRRREFFGVSHTLYAGFLLALLWHSEDFWIWFSPSALWFGVDALVRYFWKTRRSALVELRALADGVTRLRFEKPNNLHFNPGDYVWLNFPSLSRWQWHPFTLSAAPESSHLAVHVRNNGDWSGALHNLARKRDFDGRGLPVYIDGPYSAPTSGVAHARVAVLIAGGIGVTPFASVLHSLLLRPKGQGRPQQQVYFHWLNRSQKSYEWFVDLLGEAERELGQENFQLFIHLTSLSHNLSNIAMQMAADAYREKVGQDPLTQLKAVTASGRPDWRRYFAGLAVKHSGQPVDVYFCGPPALGQELRQLSGQFGFYFHQEQFD